MNDELTIYDCPIDLSGYDRKMLHQLAEQFNLGHKSHGVGPDRRLRLTKDKLFFEHGTANVPPLSPFPTHAPTQASLRPATPASAS